MNSINKPILQVTLLLISFLMISTLNAQNLEDYRWKNRILIIQTSNAADNQYKSQIEELVGLEQEFKERKLVIFKILEDKYTLKNYLEKKNTESWQSITKQFKEYLEKHSKFQILLIGLDGGTKLRQKTVLKSSELFNIIDAMPMRSSEIRNKG
ncbi:DUF4174 domain-containing protein [Croceitalea sp. MTPC9]|uniref:DUF4174 domain-containing protein n=1 Tax=unclassified Croceitalea TaxID=2632280 RepID=UPI002B3E1ECE|nr:DUF4174 domain-containing protein [Croceitalea sp. MTPC6]GMN15382.1 DUF4174 domain-containing protein [Croceitalea sp. MTPC9]